MSIVQWRAAVPEDLPGIERLWNEQEERFRGTQTKVDRPQLFCAENDSRAFFPYRAPVMRVRVAEKDGVLVGFRYVEAIPEVCLVTGDEDAMKTLAAELTEECHWAKALGFRSGWGLVPEKFARTLGRFTRYSPVRIWSKLKLIGCDFTELGD